MAVAEEADVEVDEQYQNLSPKRKEIVDAWAELYNEHGSEPKNVDVVDRADANESYVSQTLSEYKHIAEARADQLANQRDEGEAKTEGDPFGELQTVENPEPQTITERPVKQTQESQATDEDTDPFVYSFSPEEVQTIVVDGELPQSLRDDLEREVIERAFES